LASAFERDNAAMRQRLAISGQGHVTVDPDA
jgi:uncharacterized protein YggE